MRGTVGETWRFVEKVAEGRGKQDPGGNGELERARYDGERSAERSILWIVGTRGKGPAAERYGNGEVRTRRDVKGMRTGKK